MQKDSSRSFLCKLGSANNAISFCKSVQQDNILCETVMYCAKSQHSSMIYCIVLQQCKDSVQSDGVSRFGVQSFGGRGQRGGRGERIQLPGSLVYEAIYFALSSAYEHLDKGNTNARMLFIDYSSAFNSIIPSNLISKLQCLGLCDAGCKWIFSFF